MAEKKRKEVSEPGELIAFRVDPDVFAALERKAEKLTEATGIEVSPSQAARVAVKDALGFR